MLFAAIQMVSGTNIRDSEYTAPTHLACIGDVCCKFITLVMYASIMSAYILIYLKKANVQHYFLDMQTLLTRSKLEQFTDRILNLIYTEWDDNECIAMKPLEGIVCDIPTYIKEEILCLLAEHIVKSHDCFVGFSEIAVYDICAKMKLVVWPIDEPLLHAGQISDTIYFLMQGTCEMLNDQGDVIQTIINSGCFNLLETLFNVPTMKTVVARSNCKCLIIQCKDLRALLHKYYDDARFLLKTIKTSDDIKQSILTSVHTHRLDTISFKLKKKRNLFRFNMNFQTAQAEYDYHIPFDRLYPFAFIRYFLMRTTINCEGTFLHWWEVSRSLLGHRLTPTRKIYGLSFVPIVLVLANFFGSFLITRECSFNLHDDLPEPYNPEFFQGVKCLNSSLLAKSRFSKPMDIVRVQLYAIYIGTSLLTTSGMQGFSPSNDDTRLILIIMSLLGLYLTVVFAGRIITLYFFHHRLLLRYQEAMRSLNRFLNMIKVNPQLKKTIIYNYEVKWGQLKCRRLHHIFDPLPLQMKSSILFELYGKKLFSTSIFRMKSKAFFRNLLPIMRHEIICKGGYVITINDVTRYTYIVCKGEAEVLAPDGIVITTLSSGSMFGNLENKKRSRLLEYEPQMKEEYRSLTVTYLNYIPGNDSDITRLADEPTKKHKSRWGFVFDPNTSGMHIWNVINLVFSCYLCIILDLYQLGSGNSLKDAYPHDLQLYNLPPSNEIQLSEFEELALERLQLFRIFEQTTQKGLKIYGDDWKQCVSNELRKNKIKHYYELANPNLENPTPLNLQARRADHISHFILRLAYCRTDSLRKWFLARELEWFKLRFLGQSSKGIEAFLKLNNLTYSPISPQEKSKFHRKLSESTVNANLIDHLNFYKVKFTEVPSLIKHRRVFVHKGYAYIPSFELVTCILGTFRSTLNEALVYANRRLPLMDDDRINFLINNLHNIYTGKDYTQNSNSGKVGLANLDAYARDHFPLCMKYIYGVLKSTHHLKHFCRLQLGLFLKAIGLTYEDSMTFWKDEFTKKIDGDKFEKQYAYNVKHMYGLVGQRTNYSPYSCIKIINENVGPGDHHGCPYKHWDSTILKSKLNELGMPSETVQDIADTASKGHYQIACCKYFEYVHGQQNKVAINHPNQYFDESLECSEKGKNQKSQGTPKVTKKQKTNDSTFNVGDINWDYEMILTDEDFKRIDIANAKRQLPAKGVKRKTEEANTEKSELVQLGDIENIFKKRKHDKAARVASVKEGQKDRQKFEYKDGRLNIHCSRTNRERKRKNFQMIKHKVRAKVKRSFKDKQIALRNHLIHLKKMK
ncbi:hypothetical protein Trydic_g22268 [Trypoxylus dichotomus]